MPTVFSDFLAHLIQAEFLGFEFWPLFLHKVQYEFIQTLLLKLSCLQGFQPLTSADLE